MGIIVSLLLTGCAPQDDVTFARTTMEQLVQGRFSVRPRIDWTVLRIFDKNVGLEYAQYKTEQDRAGYERSFIDGFSKAFRKGRGTMSMFFGWSPVEWEGKRIKPNIKAVFAYVGNKSQILAFYIRHDGRQRKLIAILGGRLPVKNPSINVNAQPNATTGAGTNEQVQNMQ
jgi:hypothetical protein